MLVDLRGIEDVGFVDGEHRLPGRERPEREDCRPEMHGPDERILDNAAEAGKILPRRLLEVGPRRADRCTSCADAQRPRRLRLDAQEHPRDNYRALPKQGLVVPRRCTNVGCNYHLV